MPISTKDKIAMILMRTMLVAIVIVICSSISAEAHAKPSASRYRLFFPHLPLASDEGERVTDIELVQSCGDFWGLTGIPKDWSVEIISPSSGTAVLKASAGHGASSLFKLEAWNGVIHMADANPRCKDIDVLVKTEARAGKKEYRLSGNQLFLRK